MTDETTTIFPIRGQHFRKPAPTILSLLTIGSALLLKREPENEYDPNAIAVYGDFSSDEFAELRAMLAEASESEDWTLPDFSLPVHLGYVGKEYAAVIAPKLDALGGEADARLAYMPDGKPAVEIAAPEEGEDQTDLDATYEDDDETSDPGDFSEVDLDENEDDLGDDEADEDGIPY